MKKYIKLILYFVLIFTTFCSTFFTDSLTPKAAYRVKEPVYSLKWKTNQEKVHISQNDFRGTYISIQLPGKGYKVTNLVSSSKNCVATVANQTVINRQERTSEDDISSDRFHMAENWIELYAPKKGTYKIKFDIKDPSGKKVKSKILKIYANNEDAIRSVTINNQNLQYYQNTFCTSGKYIVLRVKMNSGYKLVKIVKTESDIPDTIIKNGKKFQPYHKNDSFRIAIYYKDKYTGRTEKKYFSILSWEG